MLYYSLSITDSMYILYYNLSVGITDSMYMLYYNLSSRITDSMYILYHNLSSRITDILTCYILLSHNIAGASISLFGTSFWVGKAQLFFFLAPSKCFVYEARKFW